MSTYSSSSSSSSSSDSSSSEDEEEVEVLKIYDRRKPLSAVPTTHKKFPQGKWIGKAISNVLDDNSGSDSDDDAAILANFEQQFTLYVGEGKNVIDIRCWYKNGIANIHFCLRPRPTNGVKFPLNNLGEWLLQGIDHPLTLEEKKSIQHYKNQAQLDAERR